MGGAYTETAQNSAHRAAHNSDRTTETRKGGEGSLGVSLDYSKVSRPLAKAGENIAEGNIAGWLTVPQPPDCRISALT